MLQVGAFPSSTGGMPRVRLVRKRAHCAAQAGLVEVMVAVSILTIVVWEMVGFIWNGRLLVERTGQAIIAAQIEEQQIDQARAAGYASAASANGTQTVGGILYTWVMTVTSTPADSGDSHSTFKQVGVTVTWPTAPNANSKICTAIAQ